MPKSLTPAEESAQRAQDWPHGKPQRLGAMLFNSDQLPPDKIMMIRKNDAGWEYCAIVDADAPDEIVLAIFRDL